MVELRDKADGRILGTISDEQFEFLAGHLEEEFLEDMDYYLNRETLALFEEQGIDPDLLALLTSVLGDREDMDIAWTRR